MFEKKQIEKLFSYNLLILSQIKAIYENKTLEKEEQEKQVEYIICNSQLKEIDNFASFFEIFIGVGGEESRKFMNEIFEFYKQLFSFMNWKVSQIEQNENKLKCLLTGKDVYKLLQYEIGVQRVQRIPITEKKGRIHTSTISIFVYPKLILHDININPNDLRIDTYRSSGKGGQHVNKTDSAVRITHIPSGIVCVSQKERSQIANREDAMKNLKEKLQLEQEKNIIDSIYELRKEKVKSANRNDKKRTYDFKEDKIIDHETGISANMKYIFKNITLFANFIRTNYIINEKKHLKSLLEI